MPNPFYMQNNNGGGIPQFIQFMNSMKGKNPNEILNGMIKSGKINQQQLNVVQQKAKEVSGLFDGMRSMFGF